MFFGLWSVISFFPLLMVQAFFVFVGYALAKDTYSRTLDLLSQLQKYKNITVSNCPSNFNSKLNNVQVHYFWSQFGQDMLI